MSRDANRFNFIVSNDWKTYVDTVHQQNAVVLNNLKNAASFFCAQVKTNGGYMAEACAEVYKDSAKRGFPGPGSHGPF